MVKVAAHDRFGCTPEQCEAPRARRLRPGAARWLTRAAVLLLAALVAAAVLAVTSAQPSEQKAAPPAAQERPASKDDLKTALEVIAVVRSTFVNPVSVPELLSAFTSSGTIKGMLAVLHDPYTRYLTAAEYKDMQEALSGEFGGIGIWIGMVDDVVTVIAPIEGTPAERVGLEPGDGILAVDGAPTKDLALDVVVSRIKGPPGTTVTLTIGKGKPPQLRDVTIRREVIKVRSVRSKKLDRGFGYIRIATFSETTGSELARELESLLKQSVRGIVLDLRGNGGGIFDQAVVVASMFIREGPVVHIVSRNGQKETFYAQQQQVGPVSVPVVVLVNGTSASASEIVCGALQDYKVATLVGTRTFGKGSVQTVHQLSDGSAVAVTTHRYLTAAGRSIDKKGIDPDVTVELPDDLPEGKDPQLDRALQILEDAATRQRNIRKKTAA